MDLNKANNNIFYVRKLIGTQGITAAYVDRFSAQDSVVNTNRIYNVSGSGPFGCFSTNTGSLFPDIYPPTGHAYLAKAEVVGNNAANYIIYDRLWFCSGISGNITGTFTITGDKTIPSRDMYNTSSGYGLEIWLQLYGGPGTNSNACTYMVNYTDVNNVPCEAFFQKTAGVFNSNVANRFIISSGTGVKQINSIYQSSASTGPDNLGIFVMRRIAEIPAHRINKIYSYDILSLGLPVVYSGSCISYLSHVGNNFAQNLTLYYTRD